MGCMDLIYTVKKLGVKLSQVKIKKI